MYGTTNRENLQTIFKHLLQTNLILHKVISITTNSSETNHEYIYLPAMEHTKEFHVFNLLTVRFEFYFY